MEYKKINGFWVIVFKRGEKIIEKLTEFVKKENVKSGCFNAIGAASSVELAHYDLEKKRYSTKETNQPLEIISLMGNVAVKGKEVIVHAHVSVGTDKMEVYGGHLKEGMVAATCEMVFKEFEEQINKKYDSDTGLNLMKLK